MVNWKSRNNDRSWLNGESERYAAVLCLSPITLLLSLLNVEANREICWLLCLPSLHWVQHLATAARLLISHKGGRASATLGQWGVQTFHCITPRQSVHLCDAAALWTNLFITSFTFKVTLGWWEGGSTAELIAAQKETIWNIAAYSSLDVVAASVPHENTQLIYV